MSVGRRDGNPLIIAIDGPAASGKGTLARRLADHYQIRHLDTGLSYRAVADVMMTNGHDLNDEAAAEKVAQGLDFETLGDRRAILSSHKVGEAASQIAVMPKVRRALVDGQRRFAATPPGAILDGRDIGTVVFPDAMAKLYVTASPEVRARRRCAEISARGEAANEAAILADLTRRDARDRDRADSPLIPAKDAHLLDTTGMTIEAAFLAAVGVIDQAQSG